MSPDPVNVGAEIVARINEARAEILKRTGRDYYWTDLGRAVGWSQSTSSQIRTGRRSVTLQEVVEIARELCVRVEWLAFGSGPMMEAPAETDAERQKREFLEEQARKYPPAETPQASPKKGRRAG